MAKSSSTEPRVLLEVKQQIAYVTLNRGRKYNGIDNAMVEGIIAAVNQIRDNPEIRVVILKANGKAFCTGLDVMSAKSEPMFIPNVFSKWNKARVSNKIQAVAYLWRTLDVPVIAVLHGKCLGGGLQIAMGADFRISEPDCEFAILEVKWGLIPDMAGALTFREVMRRDQLRKLTYTGETFKASRALQEGLVTEVAEEPLQRAEALAKQLIERPAGFLAGIKGELQGAFVSP